MRSILGRSQKHNTFSQRGEDDRLRPDISGGVRVASSGLSRFHTDDSHTECGTNRGQADVQFAGYRRGGGGVRLLLLTFPT